MGLLQFWRRITLFVMEVTLSSFWSQAGSKNIVLQMREMLAHFTADLPRS
jgi:hypothetical protein